jgi:hypothetical protein
MLNLNNLSLILSITGSVTTSSEIANNKMLSPETFDLFDYPILVSFSEQI